MDIGVQLLCGKKFCGQASLRPLSSLRGHEISPQPGDEKPSLSTFMAVKQVNLTLRFMRLILVLE